MRVVSLACSNTEILCALGCASLLVGVDDNSDYPPDVVDGLPRVGPDLEIDTERVLSLKPDLVLASLTVPGHETVVERVEAVGLPFLAPAPESLQDVYRDVQDIARLLDVAERGAELVADMRRALEHGPTAHAGPRILVQWWPNPVIAPGRRSWTTDLIEAAGGRNPLGDEPVKSRPVTDEEVMDLAPDAIVISWCGVQLNKYRPEVVYRNPVWKGLPALQRKQVYTVPEAYLGRPGPRLVEGFRSLQDVVTQATR